MWRELGTLSLRRNKSMNTTDPKIEAPLLVATGDLVRLPTAADRQFVEEIDTILSCGNAQSGFAYDRIARMIIGRENALRLLLRRCLPIVEADARMMADITRHAPLDAGSQAKHDSTEYESERLMREIPATLGLPNKECSQPAT